MRASVLVIVLAATLSVGTAFGAPKPAGTVPFGDPPLLPIAGERGAVVLDAYTDWVEVPGLGRVEGASFYDIDVSGGAPVPRRRSLMPAILEIAPGSTVEVRLRNHLTTIDAADLAKPAGKAVPDATNIHTHGLIVPPTGIGFGAKGTPHLGDCVYPLAASTASHDHGGHGMDHTPAGAGPRVDPCAERDPLPTDMGKLTVSGDLLYSYSVAKDHPSGLFWIHPHPHTQSEVQLSNGLSGLLVVGSIWDYLSFDCRPTASPSDSTGACATQETLQREKALERRIEHDPDGLKVRYLGLKDIEVQERADSTARIPHFDLIPFPRRPAHDAGADAKSTFDAANGARKALCGPLVAPSDPAGDIAVPGDPAKGVCWAPQNPKNPMSRAGWVFTVSGQVYPQIDVKADVELWRFANMSADVTYRLRLEADDGTILSMQPVALDGVALATSETLAAHTTTQARANGLSTSGRGVTEITLMPSARTEVLIRRCGQDDPPAANPRSGCLPSSGAIRATLRTRGVLTGATANDGDFWPAIDLARVAWDAPRPRAGDIRHPQVMATAEPPVPTADPRSATPPSPPSQAMAAPIAGGPCHPESYDHGFQPFSIDGTRARLIRFNNHSFDEEAFGIHDQILDLKSKHLAHGAPIRVANLVGEGASSPDATGSAPVLADVDLEDACQTAATNFDGKISGVPTATLEFFQTYYRPFAMNVDNVSTHHGATEYWLVVNDAPECHNFHIHQMKFAVLDADFVGGDANSLNQCAGDRKAERPINQRALQDNVPLPPYSRVLLKIDFDGPKLGRFVFHCHILKHEDKGMMANLNVVRP